MKKKSLIKSRAATKKALIASRKGTTGKVSSASVAAGVSAARCPAPSAAIAPGSSVKPAAAIAAGVSAARCPAPMTVAPASQIGLGSLAVAKKLVD